MADKLTDTLTHERNAKLTLIQNLKDTAAEEGRDLTEQDMQTIEAAGEIVKAKNRQLDLLCQDLEMAEDTQTRLKGLGNAIVAGDFQLPLGRPAPLGRLHQSDPDAKIRYGKVMRRAAEHMGTVAANTTPVAGDLGGLVVRPVVGPVADPYPKGMPFATAVGMRDIPTTDGFGFSAARTSSTPTSRPASQSRRWRRPSWPRRRSTSP